MFQLTVERKEENNLEINNNKENASSILHVSFFSKRRVSLMSNLTSILHFIP